MRLKMGRILSCATPLFDEGARKKAASLENMLRKQIDSWLKWRLEERLPGKRWKSRRQIILFEQPPI